MSSPSEHLYPALFALAQIYFGEDWPDFYDSSPMNAVDVFTADEDYLVEKLPIEIDTLLATSPTEAELRELFVEFDLLYDPPSMDDQSYRDWLQAVSDRVRRALDGPA